MNGILLQCCGCAEKIMKMVSSMETATNCKDVEIAKAVCCAMVSITAIAVIGVLGWKLIDKISDAISGYNKRNWDVKDKEQKQKSDLQDKLIDFLEKNTSEEKYDSEAGKFVKTLRGLDSEESQHYVKTMLALLSNQTIPEFPQKSKADKEGASQ